MIYPQNQIILQFFDVTMVTPKFIKKILNIKKCFAIISLNYVLILFTDCQTRMKNAER